MLQDEKFSEDKLVWSNHVTYVPISLSVHLSMLLIGIILYEYNPDDFCSANHNVMNMGIFVVHIITEATVCGHA